MHEVLVEERTKKKIILFILVSINGWQKFNLFLSSTNKTLGECGCVPHPVGIKKDHYDVWWLVLCATRTLFVRDCKFVVIFTVLSFWGQYWRFKLC